MNALFTFASGADLAPQSNYSKLMEFWSLDRRISEMEDSHTLTELLHSLHYTLMLVRAKEIVKMLTV